MTQEMIKQIERDYWAEKADPIDMAEIFDLAQRALEQEPKEITLDEVKEYCRKRCLTLVTNQLFHELTHHQGPILDKIYADIQKLRNCSCSCSDGIIDDIEDILDKYKTESEA